MRDRAFTRRDGRKPRTLCQDSHKFGRNSSLGNINRINQQFNTTLEIEGQHCLFMMLTLSRPYPKINVALVCQNGIEVTPLTSPFFLTVVTVVHTTIS